MTVKEQQEWKIPPCISNWKNAKVINLSSCQPLMLYPAGKLLKMICDLNVTLKPLELSKPVAFGKAMIWLDFSLPCILGLFG